MRTAMQPAVGGMLQQTRAAAPPRLAARPAQRALIGLARKSIGQPAPQQPVRQLQLQQHVCCSAQTPEQQVEQPQQLVGEDAAAFDLSQQSLRSWGLFGVLLTTVLAAMYVVRGRRRSGCRSTNAQQHLHASSYCAALHSRLGLH